MACIEEDTITKTYRVYMTDSIYQYARNRMLSTRWIDALNRKPGKEKGAQEILDETFLKAGLVLKE